ncbi:MAG: HipA domain-containing protein [Elusimicrobia bacterium]|nr:HipA domain-containing protein [Elusimicrobiota bacterium]
MKLCLCCQKPTDEDGRYHARCLKQLFGAARAPKIPFSVADLPRKIISTGARMSISGMQIKASIRLDAEKSALEVVASGGTYILKPEPSQFEELPQNENLCMNIAAELGINVPPHGLFPMADGQLCYVIKRFDRRGGEPLRNETMFQILEATDKYSGSLEQIGKAIREHATNVGLDTIDFFERALLSFLIGNGDMHLKNWALLIDGKKIGLAPCYDFISSRILIPNEEDSALTINGKKNKLKRPDFDALAASLKIDSKAAANSFEKLRGAEETLRRMAIHSELNTKLRQKLTDAIASRYKRLT